MYTGLRIRNCGHNTWAPKKIYMEIDGVVQRTIERCVEVQGGKTETFEVSGRHKVRNIIVNDYFSR